MDFYAFAQVKVNKDVIHTGYVTESILKKSKNKRVKMYCTSHLGFGYIKFILRKNFVTIIPLY